MPVDAYTYHVTQKSRLAPVFEANGPVGILPLQAVMNVDASAWAKPTSEVETSLPDIELEPSIGSWLPRQ